MPSKFGSSGAGCWSPGVAVAPAGVACQISTSVSGHRAPVVLEHLAVDDDPLAQRLAVAVAR